MRQDPAWRTIEGGGPLMATALHSGHAVRPEVAARLALSDGERLREEDPGTDVLTAIAPTRVIAFRSRFEVDLNRPRAQAVYETPEQAWGLRVWQEPLDPTVLDRSRAIHDRFYRMLADLYRSRAQAHGRFVVLDLHSYNHRRAGPQAPPSDPTTHPTINVGTGTLDRSRWAPVVDRFLRDLAACETPDGPLDVGENVVFRGGYHARWAHETFGSAACVLAVEVKKTYMDEWTGAVDADRLRAVQTALGAALPGVLEELARL